MSAYLTQETMSTVLTQACTIKILLTIIVIHEGNPCPTSNIRIIKISTALVNDLQCFLPTNDQAKMEPICHNEEGVVLFLCLKQ